MTLVGVCCVEERNENMTRIKRVSPVLNSLFVLFELEGWRTWSWAWRDRTDHRHPRRL